MAGRIETYVHSDKITQNKGAIIVKIICDTDFAANTQEFKDFCKKVAIFSYAYMPDEAPDEFSWWDEMINDSFTIQGLEKERIELEKLLKEKIRILEMVKVEL